MIHDISIQLTGLLAGWCSTLLYGINVVVFFICIYVMIDQRMKGNMMPLFLFFTTILQFLLSTAHVALWLRKLIDSFIKLQFTPEAITEYWTNPANPVGVAGNAVYTTNTLIGDAIMIWRLYAVWGNSWYISSFPILTLLGTAGTGYASVAKSLNPSATNIFAVINEYTAMLALSMATQTFVSCAIAFRIWWISRDSPASSRHFAVIWIIVESGAIYCLTLILSLVFTDLKTEFGGIITNMVAQTSAIVPTLVIVRVCLRRSKDATVIASDASKFMAERTGTVIKFSTTSSGTQDESVGLQLDRTTSSLGDTV